MKIKIAILVLLLGSCASPQTANISGQTASVTFYFGEASINTAFLRVPIFMDGQQVCGKTLRHIGYCTESVVPGEHTFASFNKKMGGGKLTVEAGKSYYFELTDQLTLRPATETEAQFAMQRMKDVNAR